VAQSEGSLGEDMQGTLDKSAVTRKCSQTTRPIHKSRMSGRKEEGFGKNVVTTLLQAVPEVEILREGCPA